MKGALYLEDGTVFGGEGFGDIRQAQGEVVFFTGMSGLQEALTHPAYRDAVLVMTYPAIGNCGVNAQSEQSPGGARALIVREVAEVPSNRLSEGSFGAYCAARGVAGLMGVDTRALTRHLREHGVMKGVVNFGDSEAPTEFGALPTPRPSGLASFGTKGGKTAVVLDYGLDCAQRDNLMAALQEFWFEVTNPGASRDDILSLNPALLITACGVFNETALEEAIALTRSLIGVVPIYGEGGGALIPGLSAGYRVKRLHCGHHGYNHPVREIARERVYMSEQHHLYTLHGGAPGAFITHENVTDQTIEGFTIPGKVLAVQFAPERDGADSGRVYDALRRMVQTNTPSIK